MEERLTSGIIRYIMRYVKVEGLHYIQYKLTQNINI